MTRLLLCLCLMILPSQTLAESLPETTIAPDLFR